MSTTASETYLRDVFLGRQPVLDKDQGLFGYELLFRSSHDNHAHVESATAATADVVCKAFAELGLASGLEGVRAFVNSGAEFLHSDVVELLPAETVVLEVDVRAFADPNLLPRCQALKAAGFAFAVSGVVDVNDSLWPLCELATWLKVDVNSLPIDRLQTVAGGLRTTRRALIASRVETQTQMELCSLLGFQYFQGYYFAEPVVIEGRKLENSTQGVMRLLKLLAEDADIGRIETAFRAEPGLVVNLLRLTNSVAMGMRMRINSIRHAVTVIGQRQLQRWLQLLLFSKAGSLDVRHNPLLQLAALRGRMMELFCEHLNGTHTAQCEGAFITGLMSVVPIALGMRMEDILGLVAVDAEVAAALRSREGSLGQLLLLIERYDANDIPGVFEALQPFEGRASLADLVDCLAAALPWVQQLGEEA